MKMLLAALLASLILASVSIAGSKDSNDYAKQIIGRWIGPKKFEMYYADGTWAVQRNENSKPDKTGRRWHIDGDKLTLIYPGGTSTKTIVSIDPDKFVTKDDGYEDVRKRANK